MRFARFDERERLRATASERVDAHAIRLARMSDAEKDVSYDPVVFAPIADVEDRHFWFRARRSVIETLVRQIAPTLPDPRRILEVGCGTGGVTRLLVDVFGAASVTAMDPYPEAVRIAKSRLPCQVLVGNLDAPEVTGPFSLIGMFDVLEHLPDERESLSTIRRLLAPGGVLLLTVPAHQSLWSYFDEEAGHFRRYELDRLQRLLSTAGFQVEYATEFFSLLFPAMWVGRQLAGLRRKRATLRSTDELRVLPIVNDLLAWALGREAKRVAERRVRPFGTSIIAIARERG